MRRISLPGRLAIALGVCALSVTTMSGVHAAPVGKKLISASGKADLKAAVVSKLLDHADSSAQFAGSDADDTRVNLTRSAGRWGFGSAVLMSEQKAKAYPRDWMFVAEHVDGRWRLAFDGEADFATLTARAPMLSAKEKAIFASHGNRPHGAEPGAAANGDYRTGMRLPWAIGQSWTLLGGPHAWDAGSGPWSSLDLTGGDQRVLAARDGVAYTTCTGRILIYHGDGYTTRYYHLWDHIQVDGASVSAGAFLGYTGTEVGCGGSANSRHVHFSLLQNGNYVAVSPHIIGKWVPMNGSSQYGGYALHGSTRVNVGGLLYNYGPLGSTQGIVDVDGSTTLNKRSGPGTGYPVVGTVSDGATVSISCSADGTTHTGRWGTTSLWNRLTDGTWVTDAFVYTGVSGPVNGSC